MRYHVVVFRVLDPMDPPEAQIAILDEEFDCPEGLVLDAIETAIKQLKREAS